MYMIMYACIYVVLLAYVHVNVDEDVCMLVHVYACVYMLMYVHMCICRYWCKCMFM